MKMLMKLIALTLALMMTSCGQTSPEGASTTTGSETTVTETPAAGTVTECHGELSYLLYEPAEVSENLPLIVYLHGGSGKGDDLSLLTSVDGLPEYLADGKVAPDAYVVMPQLTSDHKGWVDVGGDIMKLIGALEVLRAQGVPMLLLGNGSNILVSDEGVRGAVVKPHGNSTGHAFFCCLRQARQMLAGNVVEIIEQLEQIEGGNENV